MNETVYRARRGNVLFLAIICVVGALVLASPWFTAYIHETPFGGGLSLLNSWGPDGRVVLSYLGAGFCALAAVLYGKVIADNAVVRVDDDGIAVRHAFGTHRGYWSEFRDIKSFGFGANKSVWLQFDGKRGRKKVVLPARILGVDLSNLGNDVMGRLLAHYPERMLKPRKPGKQASPQRREPVPIAARPAVALATVTPAAKPRSAPPTWKSPPVIQEGRRIFGRRPAS